VSLTGAAVGGSGRLAAADKCASSLSFSLETTRQVSSTASSPLRRTRRTSLLPQAGSGQPPRRASLVNVSNADCSSYAVSAVRRPPRPQLKLRVLLALLEDKLPLMPTPLLSELMPTMLPPAVMPGFVLTGL